MESEIRIDQNHYTSDNYESLIQNIRDKLGSSCFRHEYWSASLVIENLWSTENELLIPTTQGYDQRLQEGNFRKFLKIVEDFIQDPYYEQ